VWGEGKMRGGALAFLFGKAKGAEKKRFRGRGSGFSLRDAPAARPPPR